MSGAVDERIDRILTLQRGRVSRQQLLEAGVSSAAVGRRLARGGLVAVHNAVYRAAGQIDVALAAETAALLALRPGALISHITAARLWGLMREGTPDPVVHATVVGGPSARRLRDVVVHRAVRLERQDIRQRHSLPVTSPAHTILDIAAATPLMSLQSFIANGIDSRVLRLQEVHDVLARHPRHPGARHLGQVLQQPPQLTRSELERIFLDLIRQAGLPMPEVNHRRGSYEPDFFWPEHRLIAEIDGYEYHSPRHAFERDRLRDQRHQAEGIGTFRIAPVHLTSQPTGVIARLAQALALSSS